jgi:hypothetical protein
MMKRVIIQLEHETHDELLEIAYKETKSSGRKVYIAELCRRAIEDWLKNRKEGNLENH